MQMLPKPAFAPRAKPAMGDRNHITQLLRTTSIARGSHSIKFGGAFPREHYSQLAATLWTASPTLD